jgi:hypothetical protein
MQTVERMSIVSANEPEAYFRSWTPGDGGDRCHRLRQQIDERGSAQWRPPGGSGGELLGQHRVAARGQQGPGRERDLERRDRPTRLRTDRRRRPHPCRGAVGDRERDRLRPVGREADRGKSALRANRPQCRRSPRDQARRQPPPLVLAARRAEDDRRDRSRLRQARAEELELFRAAEGALRGERARTVQGADRDDQAQLPRRSCGRLGEHLRPACAVAGAEAVDAADVSQGNQRGGRPDGCRQDDDRPPGRRQADQGLGLQQPEQHPGRQTGHRGRPQARHSGDDDHRDAGAGIGQLPGMAVAPRPPP